MRAVPVKHIPLRTCIATGEKKPKSELIRLVRLADGGDDKFAIKVDATGKARGRGANITPTLESLDKALAKGAVERTLKLERKLTEIEMDSLRADFENVIWEREFRQGNKKVVLKVSKKDFEEKVGK